MEQRDHALAELHWGRGGPWPPLANENSHYVNSKMTTVHYCSKRVAPLICLKFKVKLRHWDHVKNISVMKGADCKITTLQGSCVAVASSYCNKV